MLTCMLMPGHVERVYLGSKLEAHLRDKLQYMLDHSGYSQMR
jgi:hypothetical protein